MRPLLSALLQISAYSALVLGALLLFRRLAGGRVSPALRHGLWFLLVARLLLPVTLASPVQLIHLPQPPTQAQAIATPAALPANTKEQTVVEPAISQTVPQAAEVKPPALPAATATLPVVTPKLEYHLDWATALGWLWLTGVVAMATNLLRLTLRRNRQLARCGITAPEHLRRQMVALAQDLGIAHPPRLWLVPDLASPCLTAGPRPALLLPADMATHFPQGQIALALAHELTHLRRRDHLVEFLWSLLRCVHWFSPAVWLAARFVREDMELACDADLAARLNAEERGQYARMLLALFSRGGRPALALGMAPGRVRQVAERRIRGVFAPAASRLGMKALSALLALVLLVGCFTTACQPTPKEPAVIQKSGAALLQAIDKGNQDAPSASQPNTTGRPARYADIPATLQDTVTVKPYPVTVSIDAAITVPAAEKLPVTVVRPGKISQQQVDGFLAAFGQAPYHLWNSGGDIKTRDDYAKLLVEQQKNLASIDSNADYTADEKKEFKKSTKDAIQRYQKAMLTAPESIDDIIEPVFTTKYMVQAAAQSTDSEDSSTDTRTTDQRAAAAQANLEKLGMEQIMAMWEKDGHTMRLKAARGNEWYANSLGYTIDQDGFRGYNTIDGTGDIKYLKTTYDQARALAEKAVASLGLGYMSVARSAKVINYDSKYTRRLDRSETLTDFGKIPYTERGYVFHFTRNLNGVCETYTANSINYSADAPEPPYEQVEIIIDDKGIVQLRYSGPPTELGEQLSPDVKLLDFKKVRTIALEQLTRGNISTFAGDYPPETKEQIQRFIKGQVWIDNVTLGYARVKLGDGSGRYALVPAWTFFGYWAMREMDEKNQPYNTYSSVYGDRWSILTINALDGSVIDRGKGY